MLSIIEPCMIEDKIIYVIQCNS